MSILKIRKMKLSDLSVLGEEKPNVATYIRDSATITLSVHQYINLLTLNVNYSGRTAPLTSKIAFYIFIQQIYVLNILNMVYTLRFFLFEMQFVS